MVLEGTAFLDGSGRVVVADGQFGRLLGLTGDDVSRALRERATAAPPLASLIAGDGPERIRLEGANGSPACDVARLAAGSGMLLKVTSGPFPALASLELAMHAIVLARLAGSLAHEIKNPLNAMALQLAVVGDKVASASAALATACSGNLGSLKNQIGRINEVVRRYLEVADPTPAAGFDAGALLADAVYLFGHEARRRRFSISCDAAPGAHRAAADPGRVARCLLGLLWRAVATTPEGGRLHAKALSSDGEVVLSIEHGRGAPDPALAWMKGVAGGALPEMGGRLEEAIEGDTVRVTLVLPKERPL